MVITPGYEDPTGGSAKTAHPGRLAEAGQVGSLDLTPIGSQNGLFGMLALDKDQIQALRSDHAIYMAGSGRINIAGLTEGNIDKFIAALAAVAG